MRKIPLVLCCLAVVFISLCAHADIVGDPQAAILDGTCMGGETSIGSTHNFQLDANGAFLAEANTLCNTSGQTWSNLQFIAPTPNGSFGNAFQCSALDFFNSCHISFNMQAGITTILFDNAGTGFQCINCVEFATLAAFQETPLGIGPDVAFGLDFSGWVPNGELQMAANVPEPSSLLLLITGAAGLLSRRKWRRW